MSLRIKLAIGGVVIAAATAYLGFLGASSSWRYYVLVDECLANRDALRGQRLRVNGRVAPNSLKILSDRRGATFSLVGEKGEIPVSCPGPLPDNLAEEMDVVVEGTLADNAAVRLDGERVLTRCASKYEAERIGDRSPAAAPTSGAR